MEIKYIWICAIVLVIGMVLYRVIKQIRKKARKKKLSQIPVEERYRQLCDDDDFCAK